MKKGLLSILTVFVLSILISIPAFAEEVSVKDFSFSGTEIKFDENGNYSNVTYSFDGNSGQPTILVYGGIGSCYNTINFLSELTQCVDNVEASKMRVYAYDIKGNTAATIASAVRGYNYNTSFHIISMPETYYDPAYSMYRRCRQKISGNIMPFVLYVDKNGTIKQSSEGSGAFSTTAIENGLKAIGMNPIPESENTYQYIDVTFGQTEARKSLAMVNSFRNSKDAWYWNEDNKSKKTPSFAGNANLRWDYDLELLAMVRAAELAVKYSHERPSGQRCFSVYQTMDYGYWTAAENIAAGYKTIEEVVKAWREDDEDYEGQGHRRNMLNENISVYAAAHCVYKGVDYWVQLFTRPTSWSSYGSYDVDPTLVYDVKMPICTKGIGKKSLEAVINAKECRTYNITYNLNGGKNSSSNPTTYIEGKGVTKLYDPAKSGYTFVGWYSDSGFTKKVTSISKTSKGNITLYAKWKVMSFKASLSASKFVYTGKAIKPKVTVTDSKGNLLNSKYYNVSYSNNKNVGLASVKVSFAGTYKNSKAISSTFTILPQETTIKSVKNAASKKVKITWNKMTAEVTGYEIQYSLDENMKTVKGVKAKTEIIKSNTTSSTTLSVSKNQTYYFRIRTYKTVGSKKYYSSWSKALKLKTK